MKNAAHEIKVWGCRCTYKRDLEDENVKSPEYKNAPE
jgi:hypothetical protein